MPLDSSVQVTTSVGERQVLASGVVHVEGDEKISIKVADLTFFLEFKDDEGASRFTGSVTDDGRGLAIELFNHKNPLGEGRLTPIEIAKVEGRQLSITYFSNTINAENKARRLEYVLYLGDAA